ncbi:NADH-quinone oxidoreductase subunit C [Aeromicrobium sp. CFBP 8757]|uniref:NADH-quinone oxidoreductase subunit C n=1 Tax=Aeromicrobium sp. CFBP 8757 TaxID=2775288 RepID=UPI00177CC313|nr:NADH-quinone oxidoreductase subunit C [Aeromicrobium sp. CFBP 8757]
MSLESNPFGPPHRVVEVGDWHDVVAGLRADGFTYFDWLSAVDEHPEGFRLVLHVARLAPTLEHLLLATHLDRATPSVASVADVFAGAAWHERETHEMFGIAFLRAGEPLVLDPLLLPDGFEGHPLRKEFVLASRVAKAWPGAKEPGESDADSAHSPGRRRVRPPGVPDDWLKGARDE